MKYGLHHSHYNRLFLPQNLLERASPHIFGRDGSHMDSVNRADDRRHRMARPADSRLEISIAAYRKIL